MAITYQIDPATRVIRISLEGAVTLGDLAQYFAQTEADAFFDRRMNRLVLAEDILTFPPDAELDGMGRRILERLHDSDARVAVVATPTASAVVSAFLRRARLDERSAVFSREADAWKWLLQSRGPLNSE